MISLVVMLLAGVACKESHYVDKDDEEYVPPELRDSEDAESVKNSADSDDDDDDSASDDDDDDDDDDPPATTTDAGLTAFKAQLASIDSGCPACHAKGGSGAGFVEINKGKQSEQRDKMVAYLGGIGTKCAAIQSMMDSISASGHPGSSAVKTAGLTKAKFDAWVAKEAKCK